MDKISEACFLAKIEEVLTRYVDKIYPSKEALEKVLRSGKKLTFYHGIDPTGPHLHLGHSTNLLLMRRLQFLGHKIIFLVGSFTARIGDPSDKDATRKPLTRKQIEDNLKTYKEQANKIIDLKGPNPVLIKFNSEWLDKLTLEEMFKLAANFTVQQIIERDLFQKRIKANKPISLHEFLYPLLQGYDSVAMNVDGEIGGTDQTFNMLAGRLLVQKYLGKEKFVITTPLLVNPKTGKKLMSKSEGTYIALDNLPNDMYGKVMALPDETIIPCFELCTEVPLQIIKEHEKALSARGGQAGKVNPMEIKKKLAFEIVKMYSSEKDAKNAEKEFKRVFQKREIPSKVPTFQTPQKSYNIIDLLVETGLAPSRSEAKRLIEQKTVELDGKLIAIYQSPITIKDGMTIRVGKRRFIKIRL